MALRSPGSARRSRRMGGSRLVVRTLPMSCRRPLPDSSRDRVERAVLQPLTRSGALDPYEEISRQDAIHQAAVAVVTDMREALMTLARASSDHACRVICEQEDWPQRIEDSLSDLMEDSFACLPDAIAQATRELGREE